MPVMWMAVLEGQGGESGGMCASCWQVCRLSSHVRSALVGARTKPRSDSYKVLLTVQFLGLTDSVLKQSGLFIQLRCDGHLLVGVASVSWRASLSMPMINIDEV